MEKGIKKTQYYHILEGIEESRCIKTSVYVNGNNIFQLYLYLQICWETYIKIN